MILLRKNDSRKFLIIIILSLQGFQVTYYHGDHKFKQVSRYTALVFFAVADILKRP